MTASSFFHHRGNHRKGNSLSLTVHSLVLLMFCAAPVFSQTVWFKYEGNPVLDIGASGSWEARGANIFQVMHVNGAYRAWYTGEDGTYRRLGYATSRDGIQWKKFPRPVVDLGIDGGWDWREAATGHLLQVGSKYLLWYHGYDGTVWRIGYAESMDGLVWRKAYEVNPVLTPGPSSWDVKGVGFPSVMRNAGEGFKMWYAGYDESVRAQICYAAGENPKSWTKHSAPVLTRGDPGSWDDNMLLLPYVMYDGGLYEMWYAGSRGVYTSARTGYATSADGIHWAKDPRNPVLAPGPAGSWDDKATNVGGVLLEGNLYRMWYIGCDGAIDRSGYAVSPRGTQVQILADGKYVAPGKDSVIISVRVKDPSGLSFAAEIVSPDGHPANLIELLDDGAHGDGLPGDGLFANRSLPEGERNYSVRLKLRLHGQNDLRFQLDNAASFTSIGPVKLENVMFVSGADPHPGDTVLIRLALKNHGLSVQADSVTATISTANKWVTEITPVSAIYGTVGSGVTATTGGYYRLFVSPNCPLETDIPFDIQIFSAGIPRWRDRFAISVLPPWWRSNWAYGFYVAIVLGIFYGLWRLEAKRLRLKHQREMEHFQLEKMKEVDQMKSRFFANISHEFRTPLTLIEGPARQILDGDTTTDPKENASMIVKNTRRLLTLVNQLLDLSRIDSGQMKLRAEEADVVEIGRGIAAAFESMAKRKGVEFCMDFPEHPIIGWFDRDAAEKILANLLSNAFKFTPAGGRVEIRMDLTPLAPPSLNLREGGWGGEIIQVVVSDTGIGIPADQIDKVFDRFYQVDQSQTREYEGTGIGLSLTKELVELHKGQITVESEVGKGTTFTVCLPLGKEAFGEREIAEPTRPVALRAELRDQGFDTLSSTVAASEAEAHESLPLLLIIEDNADMRKYIRTHLDGRYRIGEAVNGEDGFQKAVETIPDIIISDVMMPKMDGFELCRKLRADERTNHIPVILLTAKAAAEQRLEGLETGADDYITKPFDARELLLRVKNLIEQRRTLREKFQRELAFQWKGATARSMGATFLSKAMAIVESHLSDPAFDTTAFAEEVCMSRMQLHRKLRALTNLGPGEFIRSVRMKRAALLLQQKAGNVSEIAYEVGYNNPSYFAQVFKEYTGMAPSEYPLRSEPEQK